MSRGKVRLRTWVHEGKKREAWGFTLTPAEGGIRRSGYRTKAEAQEVLFVSGRRDDLRPVRCDPPKSVQELVRESLTKRRG
jgi:hypothetical protein